MTICYVWVRFRNRQIHPVALLLAAAPVAWIVIVGVTIPYYPWNGRFVMGGVALGAATWGLILASRPVAAGVVGVAAVTVVLTMTYFADKPLGPYLAEPIDHPYPDRRHESVWRGHPFEISSIQFDADSREVTAFVDSASGATRVSSSPLLHLIFLAAATTTILLRNCSSAWTWLVQSCSPPRSPKRTWLMPTGRWC